MEILGASLRFVKIERIAAEPLRLCRKAEVGEVKTLRCRRSADNRAWMRSSALNVKLIRRSLRQMPKSKPNYYAVVKGRRPGIYKRW
jgi:hypothetical protein